MPSALNRIIVVESTNDMFRRISYLDEKQKHHYNSR
jgi:hypothetical protein